MYAMNIDNRVALAIKIFQACQGVAKSCNFPLTPGSIIYSSLCTWGLQS